MKQCYRRILALSVSALLLSGCGSAKTPVVTKESLGEAASLVRETVGQEVMTTQAKVMDIEKSILLDAQIDCTYKELHFSDTGIFEAYNYLIGDSVKKGDVIAYTKDKNTEENIEDAKEDLQDYIEDYEAAKASYEADIEIQNMKLQDNSLTGAQVIELKLILQDKRMQLKHLKQRYEIQKAKKENDIATLESKIGYNQIIAPNDGVILYQRFVEKGNYVNENDAYIGLSDSSDYFAVVSKLNDNTVKAAKKIYLLKDSKEYELTFQEPDSVEDAKRVSERKDVYSKLKIENPDDNIQYGDYGKVVVVLNTAKQVIGIPKIAIQTDTIGKFVYVNENGEKIQRYIKTGLMNDVNVEVTDGLKEGDIIYVEN